LPEKDEVSTGNNSLDKNDDDESGDESQEADLEEGADIDEVNDDEVDSRADED